MNELDNYLYSQLWSSDSELLPRGRDHREIKSQTSVSKSLFSRALNFLREESFHFLSGVYPPGSSILGSWREEVDEGPMFQNAGFTRSPCCLKECLQRLNSSLCV